MILIFLIISKLCFGKVFSNFMKFQGNIYNQKKQVDFYLIKNRMKIYQNPFYKNISIIKQRYFLSYLFMFQHFMQIRKITISIKLIIGKLQNFGQI